MTGVQTCALPISITAGASAAVAALPLLVALLGSDAALAQVASPAAAKVVPVAVSGDERAWQSLADQAEDNLAKGQFGIAEGLARQAVDEAMRIFQADHPNTAASLSVLGSSMFRQGRFAEAERSFREALDIYERRSGENSVNTASALNNLALVLERLGDYAGAELLLRRAVRILVRTVGMNKAEIGRAHV